MDIAHPSPGPPRGRFIVFEGGEASGKSTQARILADRLGALSTREPGGTALGERVRELLLDPDTGDLDPRTELALMVAARAEHVARVITPALEEGRDVVCDRFSASSVAYQGYGRGLDPDEVVAISTWATHGLEPDLVVLLDVDAATRAARLAARLASRSGSNSVAEGDRLEAAGESFHLRVSDGFGALAGARPDQWVVIDGSAPVLEIAERVSEAVASRFGQSH